MTTGSIARRYAKALFEIGEQQGNLLGLLTPVQQVASAFAESEELQQTMTNPLIPIGARREIWNDVISRTGVTKMGRNFLNLLIDKSRIEELPAIARELSRLADEKQGRLRAEVTSAAPLPESTITQLKSQLERLTGKVVLISAKEDPSLIGGLVTRVGDMMYDGSIKQQLARLRETLLGTA